MKKMYLAYQVTFTMKEKSMKNICVIGLGSMGMGMAKSLFRAGFNVTGVDTQTKAVEQFQQFGGQAATSLADYNNFDAVFLVVLNEQQTFDVLFGNEGIAKRLQSDCIVFGCATISPSGAKDIETQLKAQAPNVFYLDAPISGGSEKSALGKLSILLSGHKDAQEQAAPYLDAISEKCFPLGNDVGTASAMKAVNQLLAGVHIAAMAEALVFAASQNIEPKLFLETISQCAGTSWMLENRAPHIVEGDYTPKSSVNIWPKDLSIVKDIAEKSHVDIPLALTALAQFMEASQNGLGNEDDAAVAKIYAQKSGITLPS